MSSDVREKYAVPAEKLRFTCEPVAPVPAIDGSAVITQERAMASVEIGLEMSDGPYAKAHYNVLVTGPRSTDPTAKTLETIRRHAAGIVSSQASRVCLHDYTSPRRAAVFFVPSEIVHELQQKMREFGLWAVNELPSLMMQFRLQRIQMMEQAVDAQWKLADAKTKAFGYMVERDEEDNSYNFGPISPADPTRLISEEEIEKLDDESRSKIYGELREKAVAVVQETLHVISTIFRNFHSKKTEVEKSIVKKMVAKQTAELLELAGDNPDFARCLEGIASAVEHHGLKDDSGEEPTVVAIKRASAEEDEAMGILRLCDLNILDDKSGVTTPPVVHVETPQYSRLFGRIGSQSVGQGMVRYDHTMVEGGAFLEAHGGYLILDIDDLLTYEDLVTLYKLLQVIRTGRLTIESKAEFLDVEYMSDYRTQEMPVDVRVIAVCDRHLAHVLRSYLPEFDNLFRIDSEFDDEMDVEEARSAYATFVGLCCHQEKLREFSPEAVARLIEYGVKRAGDQRKASTEFGVIKDVITEADYWAGKAGSDTVGPEHVRRAIDDRFDRSALWVRRYREFHDDNILMAHDGEVIGQINALVVLGGHQEVAMGLPSRITARAFAGEDGVLLVQRAVEQSGPSSNTAVETIAGFLKGRLGREKKLGLTVQLSFEQCYGKVDGDSASMAEVIAIFSTLAGLPVDQRLTITGSMNQLGETQGIGGATLKIEGHFDNLVRAGLLKPGHGVVLPARNLNDLMLKEELVAAAGKDGPYRVYAVTHVDQALEIFLKRPIAEIEKLAEKRLAELNEEEVSGIRKFFRKLFGRKG